MSITLFDPQLVILRLKSRVAALRSIKGAADLAAAAADGVRQLPAAFVIPLSESGGAQMAATQVTQQRLALSYGVIVVTQNLRDARGEKALSDLTALRNEIHDALYGWQPAADFDPCERGPARLLQLDNQTLWWQDDFVTRQLIRNI